MLFAVPNIAEGRDLAVVGEIGQTFAAGGVKLLDTHSDADHNRSVFTLYGESKALVASFLAAGRVIIDRVDLARHEGVHPWIGALDVAPIVYRDQSEKGLAIATALLLADQIAEQLEIPVFLYGELANGRTRAEIRRGGITALKKRMSNGELTPDYGPAQLHLKAGAVLVAARPPLVAFNIEVGPAVALEEAQQVARLIRDGGQEGLKGVRALGLWLPEKDAIQISTNIEDVETMTAGQVVRAIQKHIPVVEAELVGMAPKRVFSDFPEDIRVRNLVLEKSFLESIQ